MEDEYEPFSEMGEGRRVKPRHDDDGDYEPNNVVRSSRGRPVKVKVISCARVEKWQLTTAGLLPITERPKACWLYFHTIEIWDHATQVQDIRPTTPTFH